MSSQSQAAIKFTFSGHETFQCRNLWLKKGYDSVNNKKLFYSIKR